MDDTYQYSVKPCNFLLFLLAANLCEGEGLVGSSFCRLKYYYYIEGVKAFNAHLKLDELSHIVAELAKKAPSALAESI